MFQTILRVSILVMLFFGVQLGIGRAEPIYDRQGDLVTPGAELWSGVFDRVNTNEQGEIISVIINDTTYRIDANTIVKTANGTSTTFASFERGTALDYYVLDGLLTKVMPALQDDVANGANDPTEPNVGSPEATPPASNEKTTVQQEDGVWKN